MSRPESSRDDLLLAFDTSAAHCAAALLSGSPGLGGQVLAAREEAMATGQAERLMPMIEEMLAGAGAGWRDLTGLGAGIGPGNFTGVRITVAAARGLAMALGIPAVGVSRLEALAHGLARPLAVAEDARRGAVYLHLFGAESGGSVLLDLAAAAEAARGLPLVGSAAAAVAALTGGAVLAPAMPLAEAVARIAAARIAAGAPGPRPAPMYLRDADAAPPREPPPVRLP